MLKKIPNRSSPELKILMETGHGDETVTADGSFSAASCAPCPIRLDGHGVPAELEAIPQLFPLDPYVKRAVPPSIPALTLGCALPAPSSRASVNRDPCKIVPLNWMVILSSGWGQEPQHCLCFMDNHVFKRFNGKCQNKGLIG